MENRVLRVNMNKTKVMISAECYLADMLSVDRDADAAVETRVQIGWNKFRPLVPLLKPITLYR